MFFDMQESTIEGGLIAFPDFVYANPERQEVKEVYSINASNSGASVSINASAEDQ